MVWIKRIVIILGLVTALFVMELNATTTLLLNSPSQDAIIDSIEEINRRNDEIKEIINETIDRDPDEEYQKLFNHNIRHTFIVEFTRDEFNGVVQDMKNYNQEFGDYRSNNYRNVTVTYIADDDIQIIENVGFRTKGNIYSRRLPVDEGGNVREVHFMLKFNETFDLFEEEPMFNDLKTREFLGVEQLLFKWNNTADPSFTNEIYSYELFEEVGVLLPNATWTEVQIVIDGKVEMRALYKLFEHYDEEFIRRNFNEEGVDEVGDLYKGSWSATLDPIDDSSVYGVRNWESATRPIYGKETNKNVYSYDTLIDFSYGINQPNMFARKQFFLEHFNIDSFLKTMAINVLVGNPDDYRGNGNNFYYYFDREGYMTYIPYDYDNSMGSGWAAEPAFVNFTLGNDIYEWGWFEWNTFGIPLWENLIEYEEYQILYEDYLELYIESDLFSEESYLSLFSIGEELYGDDFLMIYDKEYFITTKIDRVLEDIAYYRDQRQGEE